MLAPGGNESKILRMQLLATWFNLATRRINAKTRLDSRTTNTLGLDNVAKAAVYAIDTLKLPVTAPNRNRYDDATRVVDEINTNKSESY